MQRRLIYTDDLMKAITAEYNRRRTGDGLKLAWIELAVNKTPTAETPDDPEIDDGR